MTLEKKKAPWWMLRNSHGDKDGMFTLMVLAFIATTAAYVVSIFEVIRLGDNMVSFRAFDGLGYAAVVLVPLIGGYFGRRYTKAQNETSMARACIYAEVAKRKVDPPSYSAPGNGLVIDPQKVADQLYENAESELSEFDNPQDEI